MTADHADDYKEDLTDQDTYKTSCSIPAAGSICPDCSRGILDYNSLLNLVCPHCGKEWSGSFT